jgi:hypothetical protein
MKFKITIEAYNIQGGAISRSYEVDAKSDRSAWAKARKLIIEEISNDGTLGVFSPKPKTRIIECNELD